MHHASCIMHHRLLLNKVEGYDSVCWLFSETWDQLRCYILHYNTLYRTLHDTLYDKLHNTLYDTIYDTIYDKLYDTLNDTSYDILYDTLYDTSYNTLYDTLYGTPSHTAEPYSCLQVWVICIKLNQKSKFLFLMVLKQIPDTSNL